MQIRFLTAGLFMVPHGPRHFYLTEPSGAVELGSRMKSVILHEVGGVRKRMQCAHNPASPPPLPRKASSVRASCMHILWAFSVDSTGSIGYDSGVIAAQTFSFCLSAFHWCNMIFFLRLYSTVSLIFVIHQIPESLGQGLLPQSLLFF